MTKKQAREITLKIFEVILEEINGYPKQEIKENNLAEDCEASDCFEKIMKIVKASK